MLDNHSIAGWSSPGENDQDVIGYLMQQALEYKKQGQYQRAIDSLSQVLRCSPRQREALLSLGEVLISVKQYQLSETIFNHAIKGGYQDIRIIAGIAKARYFNAGINAALRTLDQFLEQIRLEKGRIDRYQIEGVRGQLYLRNKDWNSAERAYNKLCKVNSSNENQLGLAIAKANKGLYDEAVEIYNVILTKTPNSIDVLFNRGVLDMRHGHFKTAKFFYDRVLKINNQHVRALNNRSQVKRYLGYIDDAREDLKKAYDIAPHDSAVLMNRMWFLMQSHSWAEAWEAYESRTELDTLNFPKCLKTLKRADQASRSYSRLLVVREQGVGDELMFASLFPRLKKLYNDITFACDERLIRLLQKSFPQMKFIDYKLLHSYEFDLSDYDCWLPIGSIPRRLKLNLSNVKTRRQPTYLKSGVKQSHILRNSLKGKKTQDLLVGFSWVSENMESGSQRTVPIPEWKQIMEIPGCQFINLQYGEKAEEFTSYAKSRRWPVLKMEDVDCTNDFEGLAALISAMDLIITCDNTNAHLASGLGNVVWVLNSFLSDWRWQANAKYSPWGPNVHLFPQAENQNWSRVMNSIAMRLRTMAAR